MNSEKGQALPLAILALAIGTLVITPFLGHASSNLIGSRVYEEAIMKHSSSDAGVEHAIWNLTKGSLAEQFSEPGDEVTYQLGETVNGLTTTITVTANVTGEGSSAGDIGDAAIDTLEFDTTYGHTPDIIGVSGDIYAVAYRGNGNDGFLKTIEITPDGDITNSVVDTLEFDTSNCIYPSIIHISGNIYAIAYQGPGNDGFLKTVEIASDGDITNSVIDTLEFDTGNGREPTIIHVSGNIYAIAYRGNGSDGFVRTVEIASDGDITNSVIDTLEFDTSAGYYPDIILITGNIYAIAYRGNGGDGFIKTVEIASDGDITNSTLDTLEFDTSKGYYPAILHIGGNIFTIAYQGAGNDGFLKTVEIAPNGDITNSVIDTLEFDTGNGREPDIIHVSDNIFAIVHRGNGNDGLIRTIEIATDGDINNDVIDTFEFDTGAGYFPDIINISGGIFAIAYRGPGSDGFLKTVEIATSSGTTAAYEIVATTGDKTIRAFINTENTTASIVSWQYE